MPRTGTKASRSGAVLVLLTDEQRDLLKAAAKRAGLGLGPWLRMLGLREAQGPGRPSAERTR